MPANTKHRDYEAKLPKWQRARDVISGEDAVKAAGVKYLPRLDSQSDEEYAAYVARASFFGATARTLEEYLDLIFRRKPVLSIGEGSALRAFAADCDLWGSDLVRYARRVVSEVLSVGRAGSLVLWNSETTRPWAMLRRAEEIIDWEVRRDAGRSELVRLALREGDKVRVFALVDGVCFEELWFQSEGEWRLQARAAVKRGDAPLCFIPFVFHGSRHSRPEPDRLPLADIIAANLDHYRLDADYKHGLHFAALPTAWVSGFDKASALRIGSSSAWVSEVAGASAGFLEFSGTGLGHLEKAMEKVERRMAFFAAQMLGPSELSTPNSQPSTPQSGLASIVASLNESLTRVLRLAQWWSDGGEVDALPGNRSTFSMNTDLGARPLTADEIREVVNAWKTGAMSRESMLDKLKRGEVLPEGRTVAEERALIHGRAQA